MKQWTRFFYQPGLPLGEDGRRVTGCKKHIEISKNAALESMVLVKNEKNTLPLAKGERIALFGKGTVDYVKGGGGSGDVTVAYKKSILDGMLEKEEEGKVALYAPLHDFYKEEVKKQFEAGIEPGLTAEPELPQELLDGASAFANTAIISFCRFSGETWDRTVEGKMDFSNVFDVDCAKVNRAQEVFEHGDFYLSNAEAKLVERVAEVFEKVVVVMNVGGVVDTTWFKDNDSVQAVLFAWQLGIEGGSAMADILLGEANPSGKFVDTFAKTLADYPSSDTFHESVDYVEYKEDIYVGYRYFETIPGMAEKVNYPFGYGLSYTTFEMKEEDSFIENDVLEARIAVTNTGSMAGKEVVQLYVSAPQGKLGKPAKELKAFAKTKLLAPGETEVVTLKVNLESLASYDDLGKVKKSAYVLEKGMYEVYYGSNVRDVEMLELAFIAEEDIVVEELQERCIPKTLKERMLADGTMETLQQHPELERISRWPHPDWNTYKAQETAPLMQRAYLYDDQEAAKAKKLWQVKNGEVTMEEFMAQLSFDEKIHLLGGQPNTGVANTEGFGNLPKYGVPNIMTVDGPAGVRIYRECGVFTTAFPCATALACSWNLEMMEEIGQTGAKEALENNLGIWLTPAMNIHRSPLCGRNFEYFSEDPFVSGKMAGAKVRGIQSMGVAGTLKHFAVNNKETNRRYCDSKVSERALREIYLKGFEIAVKEEQPWGVMTSYNPMNGIRTAENPELINGILREEWGYQGLVMSDWCNDDDHPYEIMAGNDVKMPFGYYTRIREVYNEGKLTDQQIDTAVKHVLEYLMKIGER